MAVFPGLEAAGARVWAALRELLPLDFVDGGDLGRLDGAAAVLAIGGDDALVRSALRSGKPCFVVPLGVPSVEGGAEEFEAALVKELRFKPAIARTTAGFAKAEFLVFA